MTAEITRTATGLDTTLLLEVARSAAPVADRQRRLGDETVSAVRDAGFMRHFVSDAYGGNEGSFADAGRAIVEAGSVCASTAWLASLSAYSARFAAHLPRAATDRVWGKTPDTIVATGLAPFGVATRDGDRLLVNGTWRYVSGCDVADWFLLCARIQDSEEFRFVAIPRAQARIEPSWDSIGMSATSSDTVHVHQVSIPEEHSFDRAAMFRGVNPNSSAPVHNVPFQAVGGVTFLAPVVGATLGAVDAYAGWLGAGTSPSDQAKRVLVRAAAMADAAYELLRQNLTVLDEREFSPAAMARNERNAVAAAEMCRTVVNELVASAGTGALSTHSPLQRFWRDVNVGSSHVALRYETAAVRTYPVTRGIQ